MSIRSASLAAAAVAAALAVSGCTSTPDQVANNRWATYGNDNTFTDDWTGGDGGYSINLPDNRVAWLFSDTFLGTVTNGMRACSSSFVHNSIVLQNADGSLGQTLVHHNPTGSLVPDSGSTFYTWANGIMEGGKLKTLAYRWQGAIGNGGRIDLVTFTVGQTLQQESISTGVVPDNSPIGWGSGLMKEPDFTYIYGHATTDTYPGITATAYLARAPAGNLAGPWSYRTASGWSSNPADAAPLRYGNGQPVLFYTPNAININGAFVLVGVNGSHYNINDQAIQYAVAPNPWGPFSDPGLVYDPPEGLVYNPTFHPEPAHGGDGLLMGYSVNDSFFEKDPCNDIVDGYRPRYIRVKP